MAASQHGASGGQRCTRQQRRRAVAGPDRSPRPRAGWAGSSRRETRGGGRVGRHHPGHAAGPGATASIGSGLVGFDARIRWRCPPGGRPPPPSGLRPGWNRPISRASWNTTRASAVTAIATRLRRPADGAEGESHGELLGCAGRTTHGGEYGERHGDGDGTRASPMTSATTGPATPCPIQPTPGPPRPARSLSRDRRRRRPRAGGGEARPLRRSGRGVARLRRTVIVAGTSTTARPTAMREAARPTADPSTRLAGLRRGHPGRRLACCPRMEPNASPATTSTPRARAVPTITR